MRFAHVTPPQNPNQLPVDFRLWQYFGDQLELEHDHMLFGLPGAVRILGYRNRVVHRVVRRRGRGVPGGPGEERRGVHGLQLRLAERGRARPVLGAQGQRQGRHRDRRRAARGEGHRRVPAGDVLGRPVRGGRVQRRRPVAVVRSGGEGLAVGPAVRRDGRRARAELDLLEPRPLPGARGHRRVHRGRRLATGDGGRVRGLLQRQSVQGDLARRGCPATSGTPRTTPTAAGR